MLSASPLPDAETIGEMPLVASICLFLGILAVLGIGLAQCVSALRLDEPFYPRSDMFHYLFAVYDQWHLVFFATTCGFFFAWLRRQPTGETVPGVQTPKMLIVLALGTVILGCLGTHFVFLNYPFAMDEYYADFQAAIFAKGQILAPIPPEFAAISDAASPLLVNFHPARQTWTSNYLPIYSLLRTPFWMAGCSWLVNPLLAGLTIFALAGVISRLWPNDPELHWIGVILLVSNVQFLITSMTAYAMSAHLLVNLIWLWLYLDPSPKRQMLAPLLGVVAIGLHQPNVHLVFAFPFCCKMLLDRRCKMAAWHGFIYAAGIWLWLLFMEYKSVPAAAGDGKQIISTAEFLVKAFFTRLPSLFQCMDLAIGWAKLLVWSSFALIFFGAVALWKWKTLNGTHLCLLAGILLASATCLLFPLNQGHGWGNRYLFPYMGNFTLLAIAGFHGLVKQMPARRMLTISTAISLLIILPVRAWECHREVRPFALAAKALQALPQEAVVIDTKAIWYGQDLVRNAPGLTNTPKLLFLHRYTAGVDAWCRLHPPSGGIGYDLLSQFGMKRRYTPPSNSAQPATTPTAPDAERN